jgi:hypothetical protein
VPVTSHCDMSHTCIHNRLADSSGNVNALCPSPFIVLCIGQGYVAPLSLASLSFSKNHLHFSPAKNVDMNGRVVF